MRRTIAWILAVTTPLVTVLTPAVPWVFSAPAATAACALHTYYPYQPYAYTAAHSGANYAMSESSVGSCNGDGWYTSRFTISAQTTAGTPCNYVKYLSAGGGYDASNCVSGKGTFAGPTLYRPDGSAPIYFCASSYYGNACFSGPWENRGF